MVNRIFIDLQGFKYYSLLSKLPIKAKRSEIIFGKYLVENIKFLKTIHRNVLARKENVELKDFGCLLTSSLPLSFLKAP